MRKNVSIILLLVFAYAVPARANYVCDTCTWGCTIYETVDTRLLTDTRNGADPGCCLGGEFTPSSGINDNNNSGMVCCWAMQPGPAAVNTIWFNQAAVCKRIKLWFQGWPGNASDPRDFTVDLHEPGYGVNEGWGNVITVVDKPNDDQDMEWYSGGGFTEMLADAVRVSVTRSNEGVPGYGTGEWFSIAEIIVEGDTPTPTPTGTETPTPTITPTPTNSTGISPREFESY